jgi:hypothetical protein
MTKKQMLAECRRSAPDFSMRHERPAHDDLVTCSFTVDGAPVALAMLVRPLGRAATETRILEAALAKLKRSKAA